MTPKQTAKAFRDELKALLKKYNATIMWNCSPGSDLHGVNGEEMIVKFYPDGSRKSDDFQLVDESYLTARNL